MDEVITMQAPSLGLSQRHGAFSPLETALILRPDTLPGPSQAQNSGGNSEMGHSSHLGPSTSLQGGFWNVRASLGRS